MRPDNITRDFRHHFDPAERVRLAEDLAHELITRAESCRLFAIVKKAHDEAIEKIESKINHVTRLLCEGWEYRDVPCKVLYNNPRDCEKTIVRLDTGEEVAVEPMTEEEKQESLPMEVA